MLLALDRIEENLALCENLDTEEMITLSAAQLPEGVVEGDLMDYTDGVLTFNREATEKRRLHIRKLMNNVFE